MKIQNVTDASFRKYGKIITEYSFEKILKEMEHTPLPKDLQERIRRTANPDRIL